VTHADRDAFLNGGSALPEVRVSVLRDDTKGVAIGEEHLFLTVKRTSQRWKVKLYDLHGGKQALTAWITVQDIEDLRVVKAAKALRDHLKREYGDNWSIVLEMVISVVQDNPDEWKPEEGSEAEKEETKGESGHQAKEVDPEIVKEAQELLRDPALLYHINKALDSRLCGEYENRLVMVLVGCGARQRTSIVRLEGPNAVGKKMLYYWLPEFFGEENVVIMTGSTFPYWKRKALEGWDSRGKIIVLVEERGDFVGATKYAFEQIYSEDKIVLGMNIRNEEGEWEPVDVTLQGPLVFITSTTEPERSLHGATREWSVHPDDTEEQTRLIDRWWRERELLPKSKQEEENREIAIIRHALSLLKPYEVKIPFIKNIKFPLELLMDRRKARDFDNLIRYSAFLHQQLRPIIDGIIYALPHDYYIAERIAKRILAVSRGALTTREESLLKYIRDHPELTTLTEEGKPPREDQLPCCFRVADIALTGEYRNVPEGTIRHWLNSLARKKALKKIVLSRRRVLYRVLNADSSVGARSISLSPISLKEYISALSLSFNNGTPVSSSHTQIISGLWKQPVVDPITDVCKTLTEDGLLKLENEAETGLSAPKKPENMERVESKLTALISPDDVLRLTRLDPSEAGTCCLCGAKTTLEWQVEKHNGEWCHLCGDCGLRLQKQMGNVE